MQTKVLGQTVYQMRRRRPPSVEVKRPRKYYRDNVDQEIITPIQGKMPGSKPEWRFARGLDYVGLEYYYQYSIGGGSRGYAGGQVIDFLVKTAPQFTPVYIQGDYWHYFGEREYESAYKIAQLEHDTRGYFAKAIEIDADSIISVPVAVEIILATEGLAR